MSPILLVFIFSATVPLHSQPTVRDFGAVGDGVADDSGAFERGIRSLDGFGGALRIPKGTYNLGQTGIIIPKTFGGIRLIGDSATATRLIYSGAGAALQMGVSDGLTYGHTISDLQIDLTDAGPEAVGVRIFPGLYFALIRVYLTSNNTFPAEINHQVGIVAVGGDSTNKMFGSYVRIEDPRVNGRFQKGIYFTAPEIGWGFNSCILEGGAIVYPGAPQKGTIGIHIEQGNQNVITLVDVEQYETGILSEAYANVFLASRTEGNTVGIVLAGARNDVTGGAYNRVVSGFHADGLINHSQGTEIIATEYPAARAAAPQRMRRAQPGA
jgi:hypothetical protein